jgi:hypothetical protein
MPLSDSYRETPKPKGLDTLRKNSETKTLLHVAPVRGSISMQKQQNEVISSHGCTIHLYAHEGERN